MKQFSMFLIVILLTLFTVGSTYKDPHYVPGHDTMVHLFEWKWKDIADECQRFLGPMGYGGVQVSPIQENIIVQNRPWYERYQPISYRFNTRSGNETEFRQMVQICNEAGVRIYVDAVFNHMTGNHAVQIGTGGSQADAVNRRYYAVPYESNDFNYQCDITDYTNPTNVRNCELLGLHDLNHTSEYVRGKIVDFLNSAIDAGVAGFRIDAAKHMWPKDLKVIYSRLNDLSVSHGFPERSRPYIFQEVIDYGYEVISRWEYNDMAAVTEFSFGEKLSNAFKGNDYLKWLVNWGEAWNLLPSKDALVFIDNHDIQRDGNHAVLTYKSSKLYKMAVAFMLAHPYGTPRVMSSYHFDNFETAPPADSSGNLISPEIHNDNTCGNGWVCEHRWRQIYNMVRFRNAVNGTEVTNWWDNGRSQIAFCRGDAGFVAFNGQFADLKITLDICLPPGIYCDVISGNLVDGKCTGKTVIVNENKTAYIEILSHEEDGVLALHRKAKL